LHSLWKGLSEKRNSGYAWLGNVIESMGNADKIKRGEPVQNPDKIIKATMGA
jgi:hypothetical protein